jgi:hypothetical protein
MDDWPYTLFCAATAIGLAHGANLALHAGEQAIGCLLALLAGFWLIGIRDGGV